ncbi:hypothetical protein D3C76_1701200 [compost metagenome]
MWGAIGTIGSQGLALWRAVRAILSDQAFFFQAIVTAFGKGLALRGTVGTIGGDGLAEHRAAVFYLWSSLISGRQCKRSAGQHGKGKAKQ